MKPAKTYYLWKLLRWRSPSQMTWEWKWKTQSAVFKPNSKTTVKFTVVHYLHWREIVAKFVKKFPAFTFKTIFRKPRPCTLILQELNPVHLLTYVTLLQDPFSWYLTLGLPSRFQIKLLQYYQMVLLNWYSFQAHPPHSVICTITEISWQWGPSGGPIQWEQQGVYHW